MGQTMVERVARAMCERDGAKWDAGDFAETANGDDPEDQREYWRERARAALEAMREPTEAMCMVDGPGDNHTYRDAECRRIFQRMIDAALAEG